LERERERSEMDYERVSECVFELSGNEKAIVEGNEDKWVG